MIEAGIVVRARPRLRSALENAAASVAAMVLTTERALLPIRRMQPLQTQPGAAAQAGRNVLIRSTVKAKNNSLEQKEKNPSDIRGGFFTYMLIFNICKRSRLYINL